MVEKSVNRTLTVPNLTLPRGTYKYLNWGPVLMASIIPKENLLLFVGIKAIETLSSKTRETCGIVILHFHLSVSVLPIEDTN